MTGTVVESRPGGRAAAIVFLVAAAGLVAMAVGYQSPHPGVLALLPLVLGVAALIGADPPTRFEVTEEGLVFDLPDQLLVRYEQFEGLTAPRKSADSFSIQVYYPDGVVRIPGRLNVSSRTLYRFLASRLPGPGVPDPATLPSALRGFLAEQLELFGTDRVFVFRARRYAPRSSYAAHVAYSLAVAVAGAGWIACGAALGKEGPGWIGGGIAALVIGLLCAFVFSRQSGGGRARNWQDSCLVISPGGIALVQQTLRGRMRWDELREVDFPAKPRFALSTAGGTNRGIGLLVEGAYLIVADYYDRPLAEIYDRLVTYWGGEDAN
jgi:hypothetical protein